MHIPDQMFAARNHSDHYGQGHLLFTVTMAKKFYFFFLGGLKKIHIWQVGQDCGKKWYKACFILID